MNERQQPKVEYPLECNHLYKAKDTTEVTNAIFTFNFVIAAMQLKFSLKV